MYLKQVTNDKTGCIPYIGYCFSCKVGYVVDPLVEIDHYLQVAGDSNIQITHIFDTIFKPTISVEIENWQKKQEPKYTCMNLQR
jgi:hypothetical protein